ncbi:hypothetical protein CTI12_AA434910 [Artemisia annua]|uniref:Zinc knuckle CX2CX4HX4C n=1 Tax=Artemisia annua TaxID=35608 RepID=A0A2U1M0C0_ARTAN|nr:hypothetical protein CTI12_AA434910 [Artemisia annua]
MDRMTTAICEKPYGRASFARVLVEIDSSKALVDNVELWYESLGKILKIWVEYTWVPPRCEECKVYGHYLSECAKKVNTVSKVNKDGDNVKVTTTEKAKNVSTVNNGDGNEGWQTSVNRKNNRGVGNNVCQGPVGGYNVGRGFNNNRGNVSNRGNQNAGNVGNRDANKKFVPVSNGNTGKVDECVVINENGENGNNSGNKNDMVTDKGEKSAMGRKVGDEVSGKVGSGAKNVSTSNRFDLLRDDSASEEPDPWKEVKESVVAACNTDVPIAEDVLKGWNADMIKFYSVKWNNRAKNSGHVKQQLDNEMKSLVGQIVQLNRNLNKNSKLNAEKLLKESVVANQNVNDVVEVYGGVWFDIMHHDTNWLSTDSPSGWYYNRLVILIVSWASYFCLSTGFWCCNRVFDCGDAVSDHDSVLWIGPCSTGVNKKSELRVASCAGCRIVVLEVRRLCTTGTDPSFCAGILYWIMKCMGLSYGKFSSGKTASFGWGMGSIGIVIADMELFKFTQFWCYFAIWSSAIMDQVTGENATTICSSPVFRFSVLLSMGHIGMVMFGTPLVGPFGDLHIGWCYQNGWCYNLNPTSNCYYANVAFSLKYCSIMISQFDGVHYGYYPFIENHVINHFCLDIVCLSNPCRPVVFWVCWFCLGTGFWKCNQVFDRGVDKLENLLCTTETRVASCAGCLIDGLGYRWLCTTGTDSNFCAGNLYWLTWSTDQDTMHYKGHVLTFVLVFFDYDDNDGLICIFGDITKFWIGAIICGNNQLCTTENWTSFCAGLPFGCLGYCTLCTTEPSSIFCAGCFVLVHKEYWTDDYAL